MKKVLQFWSGGADSTYLLLQNLLNGCEVTRVYIKIENNPEKTKRELQAQKLLEKDIVKFCKHFNIKPPEGVNENSIAFGYREYPRASQQIVFAAFSLLLGRGYDEIQTAVVKNDWNAKFTFYEDIIRSYKKVIKNDDNSFPEITMPLKDVWKEHVYLALQGYDKLLKTNFLEHLTCCEYDDVCECLLDNPAGQLCEPCQLQQEVFKRIGIPLDKFVKRRKKILQVDLKSGAILDKNFSI